MSTDSQSLQNKAQNIKLKPYKAPHLLKLGNVVSTTLGTIGAVSYHVRVITYESFLTDSGLLGLKSLLQTIFMGFVVRTSVLS